MKMINRTRDILGGACQMERLLTLKNFPIHMGVTEEKPENDITEDMIFSINRITGMIQVEELVPGEVLYRGAHYNNVAANWKEHHKAFADFIARYHPKNIFEPGGGTGVLAKEYMSAHADTMWTIMDAVPNKTDGCKAQYLEGFFDENTKICARGGNTTQ